MRVDSDLIEQLARFTDLLHVSRQYYGEHAEDAAKVTAGHEAEGIAPAENAAWVIVTRMILNLDEFIVRD